MNEPTMQQPTKDYRGTIIICDHLYRTTEDKWVIAGTYNTLVSHRDHVHLELPLYIRLQAMDVGNFQCKIKIIDRARLSTEKALMETSISFDVKNPNDTIEIGLTTPAFDVRRPAEWNDLPPGRAIQYALTIWLQADNMQGKAFDLASATLRIIFPKENPTGGDHGPDPDARTDPGAAS